MSKVNFQNTVVKEKKRKTTQDKATYQYLRSLLTAAKETVRPNHEDLSELKKVLHIINTVVPK